MAVRGLWEWRWGSIGLNLTATAAGGRTALLYTAMADILPQETIANLDGKQQGRYFRKKLQCVSVFNSADTACSLFHFLSHLLFFFSSLPSD